VNHIVSRLGLHASKRRSRKYMTIPLTDAFMSQPQFAALKKAVANERKLRKTIKEMAILSRQIIFGTAPDTRRRKPLSKKVLGLI